MQINKYIAHSGVCSRRKADELVGTGAISVNGKVMNDPAYRLQDGDEVSYRDTILVPESHIYIVLNKPKGYIATAADEKNRKTVLDLVRTDKRVRLYPVGRLDRATTGILILTNDGFFAQKMSHPRNKIAKRYKVTLDKPLPVQQLQNMRRGLKLADGFIKPDSLVFVEGSKRTELIIELHSGRNRIIRRFFSYVGTTVTRLDRFYYAGLTKSGLAPGAWRNLTKAEFQQLYKRK